MTNLPDDCQRLLELARDGHDPVDTGPRLRVRQAVAASLALSAVAGGSIAPGALPATHAAANNSQVLSSAAHTTLSGKTGLAVFMSKLGAVATAAIAAAGIGYAVYRTQQPAPRVHLPNPSVASAEASAPEATVVPVAHEVERQQLTPDAVSRTASADSAAQAAARGREAAGVARSPLSARRNQRASTLGSETALLRTASEAIARGDESAALDALGLHARQFPQGSLREERDGLRAIAECTRDTTPSAASAKRFARLYPHSMLSARVAKACADK